MPALTRCHVSKFAAQSFKAALGSRFRGNDVQGRARALGQPQCARLARTAFVHPQALSSLGETADLVRYGAEKRACLAGSNSWRRNADGRIDARNPDKGLWRGVLRC